MFFSWTLPLASALWFMCETNTSLLEWGAAMARNGQDQYDTRVGNSAFPRSFIKLMSLMFCYFFLVIKNSCRDYASSDMCIEWKRKDYCKSVNDAQSQCAKTCGRCKQGLLCPFYLFCLVTGLIGKYCGISWKCNDKLTHKNILSVKRSIEIMIWLHHLFTVSRYAYWRWLHAVESVELV